MDFPGGAYDTFDTYDTSEPFIFIARGENHDRKVVDEAIKPRRRRDSTQQIARP